MLHLKLELNVAYDPHMVDAETLAENLKFMITEAVANGVLTGETEALVDHWSGLISEKHGHNTIPVLQF